jgi:hypothetical protein
MAGCGLFLSAAEFWYLRGFLGRLSLFSIRLVFFLLGQDYYFGKIGEKRLISVYYGSCFFHAVASSLGGAPESLS